MISQYRHLNIEEEEWNCIVLLNDPNTYGCIQLIFPYATKYFMLHILVCNDFAVVLDANLV